MSCLTTIILVLASRIAIAVWWLTDPERFTLAVKSLNLPSSLTMPTWVWPVLGFVFLPWTTLTYLYVFPAGIIGYEWIVLAGGLIFDLAGHGGSLRRRRKSRK